MFISLKRVIKNGWKSFFRNIGLNMATIFIMVMVIFLSTMLFLLNPISKTLISSIEEKVDISVYFKQDVSSEDILEVKAEIANIPEVKEVEYISKDRAFEKFTERHKDDPTLMESLVELGENPFLASINIRAQQASQYEQVANFLENSSFKDLFNKVDYYQRKPLIDKISSLTSGVNNLVIFLSIILGVIAVLVAFNAIKLAIYNSSEEISVMRLVGASNWFIRGPFLIQGIMVGIFAALIALLITFGISYGIDSRVGAITPEISTFGLFIGNFWILLLIQLATGIGLGIISSTIAIRRYLKV